MNNMGNSNSGGSRRGSLIIDNSEKIIKMCAMACACTFGIGSHFSSHIIGPMKGILMERLDLTNTQFSLLVASLTLCNTVIPIVSGLLVARFGTTRKVGLMIMGFMVFGVGLAPLTIVQETIIVQFFHGSGLGFALAVGLTLGRLVILAVPLSMMPPLAYRTPFIAATFTCFVSWIMNFVYIILLKHADNRKNHNKGGVALLQVVEKKKVHWDAIFDLSDLFWWFLVVGLLCGSVLSPFVHLSR
ncbi:4423_t:CDS:2 [Diversispora eburnea]|uniref:4423_t:CDS:1 n=1 Tax=Diversispora eburnea TaxID=1213867 RepID=A0A9N9FAS5_9GLOM|nr:4423_t:CDS:2 [Diversispora eburnea]